MSRMSIAVVAALVLVCTCMGVSGIELDASVRPSVDHPQTLPLKSCGPLCDLDLPGIIAYQGYPVERHPVVPADNKVTLNMFRIPCGRNTPSCPAGRPAVFLQHGLLDSGTTWILNPVDDALGFILADAGYDVWIGNNRGNTYSPCTSNDCWSFSYDEMALYDLPAQLYYVLNYTNSANISYIGHSQGTTQAFAGFSRDGALAARVNIFIALAPAVYVNHQKSPLVSLLVDFDIAAWIKFFGFKQFLPSSWFLQDVAKLFCNGGIVTPLCEDIIFALCGTDPSSNHDFNQSRADVYLTHTPAGTSVQNMVKWTQAVKANTFQMYDWGKSENQKKYGQPTPPAYDLSHFSVPTAVFSGGYDVLADPQDVLRLMSELPQNIIVYQSNEENYDHLDFVWGMDAANQVYGHVLNLLAQYAA